VTDKLLQNGTSTAVCQLVDPLGAVQAPCAGATDAQLVAASGVHADGATNRATQLAGLLGFNTFTVSAGATAGIQPLMAVSSPFIICGAAHTGWNILNNDNSINSTSATQLQDIPIQAPQVPTCGAKSNSFKGQAAPGAGAIGLNTWVNVTTGNGYNAATSNAVASLVPCPADITTLTGSCGMIIAIAGSAQGNGGSTQMQIVNFAVFNVTAHPGGNPRFSGTYVGPSSLATQGQGAYGVRCTAGSQVCMVKLAS
jgi:hypothetical protein